MEVAQGKGMKTDSWRGLYKDGWKGEIVPEAFVHPAKFSRALIRHIYQHCVDEGWLKEGDAVLDPFGGVALGGLDAMRCGLHWVGVELEPKFVALGQQNIDLWNARYAGRFRKWGSARIIRGDSRKLLAVLQESGAAACVASPPFQNKLHSHNNFQAPHDTTKLMEVDYETAYGRSPGQLGAMPEGLLDAAIASPPFLQTSGGVGVTSDSGPLADAALVARHAAGNAAAQGYGESDGNLGNMPQGDLSAIVSSPPYEGIEVGNLGNYKSPSRLPDRAGDLFKASGGNHRNYSVSAEQVGAMQGETFWAASRLILEQTRGVLRPDAHACWVLKPFVRDHAIVDFPDQWRQVCESVGFRLLHVHVCLQLQPPPL